MNIEIIRWILIGVFGGGLILFFAIQPILKKYKVEKNNLQKDALKNHTCSAPSCNVWYKKMENSRYCEFHKNIQEIYLKLIEKKSETATRANMYMNLDAKAFDEDKKIKIIQELKKLIK